MRPTKEELEDMVLEHIRVDTERYNEIMCSMKEIKETLKPIAETYKTATTLGKWWTGFVVGLAALITIIWGLIQIVLHR